MKPGDELGQDLHEGIVEHDVGMLGHDEVLPGVLRPLQHARNHPERVRLSHKRQQYLNYNHPINNNTQHDDNG